MVDIGIVHVHLTNVLKGRFWPNSDLAASITKGQFCGEGDPQR